MYALCYRGFGIGPLGVGQVRSHECLLRHYAYCLLFPGTMYLYSPHQ